MDIYIHLHLSVFIYSFISHSNRLNRTVWVALALFSHKKQKFLKFTFSYMIILVGFVGRTRRSSQMDFFSSSQKHSKKTHFKKINSSILKTPLHHAPSCSPSINFCMCPPPSTARFFKWTLFPTTHLLRSLVILTLISFFSRICHCHRVQSHS